MDLLDAKLILPQQHVRRRRGTEALRAEDVARIAAALRHARLDRQSRAHRRWRTASRSCRVAAIPIRDGAPEGVLYVRDVSPLEVKDRRA